MAARVFPRTTILPLIVLSLCFENAAEIVYYTGILLLYWRSSLDIDDCRQTYRGRDKRISRQRPDGAV